MPSSDANHGARTGNRSLSNIKTHQQELTGFVVDLCDTDFIGVTTSCERGTAFVPDGFNLISIEEES
ncbi:hypothetical protein CVU37_01920 [candidate division BRC1 bacterium HGW-BRC1-1]|nr:MAG: hypothetical protein CVU37_01920 [candidate division BRC1 bacterium HGW-BRC1-1]